LKELAKIGANSDGILNGGMKSCPPHMCIHRVLPFSRFPAGSPAQTTSNCKGSPPSTRAPFITYIFPEEMPPRPKATNRGVGKPGNLAPVARHVHSGERGAHRHAAALRVCMRAHGGRMHGTVSWVRQRIISLSGGRGRTVKRSAPRIGARGGAAGTPTSSTRSPMAFGGIRVFMAGRRAGGRASY